MAGARGASPSPATPALRTLVLALLVLLAATAVALIVNRIAPRNAPWDMSADPRELAVPPGARLPHEDLASLKGLVLLADVPLDALNARLPAAPEDGAARDAKGFVRASALSAGGSLQLRVLGPETMATADFKGNRLTIHVDEGGVIKRASYT